jgi:hypothetical protein
MQNSMQPSNNQQNTNGSNKELEKEVEELKKQLREAGKSQPVVIQVWYLFCLLFSPNIFLYLLLCVCFREMIKPQH